MSSLRQARDASKRFLSRDVAKANRLRVLAGEPWFIDRLEVSDCRIVLEGWAFPPMGRFVSASPRFQWNERDFDVSRVRLPRLDVGAKFWNREESDASGFFCEVAAKQGEVFRNGCLELGYLNPAERLPRKLKRSWFQFDPALEQPVPASAQRFRVIGNDDEKGFLLGGATDFFRLCKALHAFTGRGFETFASVLDWGSGCGRLARYVPRSRAGAFTGCDVDGENVNWCSEHLAGRYVLSPMTPPCLSRTEHLNSSTACPSSRTFDRIFRICGSRSCVGSRNPAGYCS